VGHRIRPLLHPTAFHCSPVPAEHRRSAAKAAAAW
jgi:hypothetical protein